MPLGSSIRQGIGTFWRGVLSAVQAGQSAFQTVTGLGDRFRQAGLPVSVIEPGQIDQLTGLAASWVHATYTTSTADDTANITSGMVAMAPWSMDLNQFNTMPGYHIVVGINVEGQSKPVYRTITGVTTLPATVGELRDLAIANAHAMSVGTTPGGGVGGTVTGLHSVTVTVAPSGA